MTLVVFAVMAAAPGGIGANLISQTGQMNPDERAEIERYLNEQYGLDDPAPIQYLRWLNNALPLGFTFDENRNINGFGFKDPNLGHSFVKQRPVLDMVEEALPITLLLNVLSLPIVYGLSILMGTYTARFRGRGLDVAVGTGTLAGWSIPTMWAGVMLIGTFASKQALHWFPTGGLSSSDADTWTFLPTINDAGFQSGYLLDVAWHLVLPVVCLAYNSFAFLTKLTRASVLENLSADYSRTARAKGVAERDVLWRHVFRNSLLPLITVAASVLPGMVAGSIIVETIFSINGMGLMVVEAVQMRDREVVLAITVLTGSLTLISYLIADIAYAIADPRVSYE